MYFVPYMYQYPHSQYANAPMYNYGMPSFYSTYPNEIDYANHFHSYGSFNGGCEVLLKDCGPKPYVVDINEATKQNNTYRTALWTGTHLQVTLMSLNVGEDIGLEMHPDVDQFLRIEQGQGIVRMGERKNNLNFERSVCDDSAIMIPAGTWHNLTNTGNIPLKI